MNNPDSNNLEEKKLSPGLFTPAHVIQENICLSARILLGLICSLDHPEKGCYASNHYLANILNLTPQTISNNIQLLIKLKYIKTNRKNDQRRVIKLTRPYKVFIGSNEAPYKNFIGTLQNSYRHPIKTLEVYNINKDIKEDIKNSSKKNKKVSVKPSKFKFIEFWNELDNVPKHKDETTKTYSESRKLINALRKGTIGRVCGNEDKIIKKNEISPRLLTHKFTSQEIKRGLTNLSLNFSLSHWPPQKNKIPRQLYTLIYNPNTHTSWFLKAFANKPKPLAQQQALTAIDPNPDYTELFSKALNFDSLSKQERSILFAGVQSIIDMHPNLNQDRYGKVHRRFKHPFQLAKAFAHWIDETDWLNGDVNPRSINASGKLWIKFADQMTDDMGVSLV